MTGLIALGYVSTGATDLDAWRTFATDVLGAQISEDTTHRLRLRLDERAFRIEVREADHDMMDLVGWEVQTEAELMRLASLLPGEGFPIEKASDDEVRDRGVSGLISFVDPAGMTIEIFYGQKRMTQSFVSPIGAKFVTGPMGLGHVSHWIPDLEAHRHLFMDVLGLRLSDYIDFGPTSAIFLHANRRHHSLALIPQPAETSRVSHLMLQVEDFDSVGITLDLVREGKAKMFATLGKHTNDQMTSFYLQTPSDWAIEYGYGGLEIDDATWTPVRWDEAHIWGGHSVKD